MHQGEINLFSRSGGMMVDQQQPADQKQKEQTRRMRRAITAPYLASPFCAHQP
jgi:hypothetical protein